MAHPPHVLRTNSCEQADSRQPFRNPERLRHLFRRLDAQEARLVRIFVTKSMRHPKLLRTHIFLNLMGNGWLYLCLVVLVLLLKGWQAWRFLLAGSVSVIIAHSFYPWIKGHLARQRPYDFDPTLGATIKALDQYSCPSGHCMTAAAVGVPLAIAFPSMLPAVVAIWLLIAWSRISLGHHYLTDLLAGAIIGAAISLPVSVLILRVA